jgi:catechol 2,3-dioxygenase-like lactoylglutathione lyase family enzyme
MINGAHVVVYSKNPEADRAFFRDVLKLPFVDAGHEWLIFALPASESSFHPAEAKEKHELYLMCDDVKHEMKNLRANGVECEDLVEARWGFITKIRLPGGGALGLYQPKHPRPQN